MPALAKVSTEKLVRVQRVVRWVYYSTLVLSAILATCLSSWFLAGLKPMYVVSESMEPVFYKGDIVLLSSNSDLVPTLSKGNVVALQPDWFNRGLVTHRLIASDSSTGTVTTKGDNNQSSDPQSLASQVKGVLVAKVPFLGWLLNKPNLILVAFLSLASFIADMMISRVTKSRPKPLIRNPFDKFVLERKLKNKDALKPEELLKALLDSRN